MIVMLLFLYPMLGANQLVGTDLTQAVPLTIAAALGALAFGHIEFSVTTSIIIGSVPAVIVRFVHLLAGPRPVHPTGHHVRDLRLWPQIRGAELRCSRLGVVRDTARGRNYLAVLHATLAERRSVGRQYDCWGHTGRIRQNRLIPIEGLEIHGPHRCALPCKQGVSSGGQRIHLEHSRIELIDARLYGIVPSVDWLGDERGEHYPLTGSGRPPQAADTAANRVRRPELGPFVTISASDVVTYPASSVRRCTSVQGSGGIVSTCSSSGVDPSV